MAVACRLRICMTSGGTSSVRGSNVKQRHVNSIPRPRKPLLIIPPPTREPARALSRCLWHPSATAASHIESGCVKGRPKVTLDGFRESLSQRRDELVIRRYGCNHTPKQPFSVDFFSHAIRQQSAVRRRWWATPSEAYIDRAQATSLRGIDVNIGHNPELGRPRRGPGARG